MIPPDAAAPRAPEERKLTNATLDEIFVELAARFDTVVVVAALRVATARDGEYHFRVSGDPFAVAGLIQYATGRETVLYLKELVAESYGPRRGRIR